MSSPAASARIDAGSLVRDKQDIERINAALGNCKLTALTRDQIRGFYQQLREQASETTGKPLAEGTIAGVHSGRFRIPLPEKQTNKAKVDYRALSAHKHVPCLT